MKDTPFDASELSSILREHKTPFYLYDEGEIRGQARQLNKAFSWNKNFKNYFAVKATPNPNILKILQNEDMGFDCSSLTELMLMERMGISSDDIMFSSNNTTSEEYKLARKLDVIINLDDISHIDFLEEHASLPDLLSFRYNSGSLAGPSPIIGDPLEAKFGMTKEQIPQAIELAKTKGVKQFGLHTMMVSNNLDVQLAKSIVESMFELATELFTTQKIKLEFINLGGGIGIPYKPDEKAFDIDTFAKEVESLYAKLPYKPSIFMENGRFITGPAGYLITTAIHHKNTYKDYIGVDAAMHNLMRPGMYGAYHHITVVGKKGDNQKTYDVVGSLCENNDKFAIDRSLPEIKDGDVLVIHDVGAHGHAMGFNYNGKLRSAELLRHNNGSITQIRRAEVPQDYFATLDI